MEMILPIKFKSMRGTTTMSTIAIRVCIRPRIATASLLVICVALVLASFSTTACSSACGNRIVERIASPDKTKTLYIFERDCGATTDFVTHVAVLDYSSSFDNSTVSNVFAADSNRGKVDLTVRARWISPSTVKITYPSGSRVYNRAADANGVHVSYDVF